MSIKIGIKLKKNKEYRHQIWI